MLGDDKKVETSNFDVWGEDKHLFDYACTFSEKSRDEIMSELMRQYAQAHLAPHMFENTAYNYRHNLIKGQLAEDWGEPQYPAVHPENNTGIDCE